jgi:hypothetical protein
LIVVEAILAGAGRLRATTALLKERDGGSKGDGERFLPAADNTVEDFGRTDIEDMRLNICIAHTSESDWIECLSHHSHVTKVPSKWPLGNRDKI